jgi:hypothetical protein
VKHKKRRLRSRRNTAHSSCVTVSPPSREEETAGVQHVGENEVYTAIAYAGDSKECVKLPKRAPILLINSKTYGTLRCLMDKFPHTEWGMYLLGNVDEDGDGICSSHLIPRQRVSTASVLPDSSVDGVVCWLHSHHGMGAWHSGTDREHANYPFIATVSLQQGKFDISSKKRIMLPCCNKYVLVDTDVQYYFSDVEEENVADENITTPAPATVTPSGQMTFAGPYTYYNNSVPKDSHLYHPVGHPCKFGIAEKSEGCQWRCRAATKNYYKESKQHIFCDEQRAKAIATDKANTSPTITFPHSSSTPAPRESETEVETKPFAPACREGLAIYAINGEKVVAVRSGDICPAKGYACQLSCRHAISGRTIEQGANVIFCVRKAEARRQAALEEIYAERAEEPSSADDFRAPDLPVESD